MGGVKLDPVAVDRSRSRFDLTFMVESFNKAWTVVTEYNTDIFDQTTIERISCHYRSLLEQLVARPDARLSEFDVLGESEHQQLLAWSGGAPYRDEVYLHQLFEQQVEKTPNADALVFGPERLSYAELDQRANQIANYLCGLGAGPEVVVGLCVERSVEMIAGMLAILKTGAVYLPLEPRYPAERLHYMVQDAQARIVMTQSALKERLSGMAAQILAFDEALEIAHQPENNPVTRIEPDNLAYIIYTSGSTGRPKGVGVSHRSICPLIQWGHRNIQLNPEDRLIQYLAFGFDWWIWETILTLSSGASLYLMSEKSHLETER